MGKIYKGAFFLLQSHYGDFCQKTINTFEKEKKIKLNRSFNEKGT